MRRHSHFWGQLPDGTGLSFPVIELGAGRPHAVFTAGVHGDEYEGPLALHDLARALERRELAGRVTILPFVNAPALWAGTRLSPLDGVNLARIFPGDAQGGPSARLAAAVWSHVAGADALFDCHSGGSEMCFIPVAGFYGPGGGISVEAAAASRGLAEATGIVDLWHLPATPGVLSHEAARAGIAATGAEVGGRGGARPGDVAIYRAAFLRLLAHLGIVKAQGEAAPSAVPPRVLGGDWTLAPEPGLFRVLAPLGAEVTAGTPLARIEAPGGDVLATLEAAHDGVILAERNLARVRAGDLATFVARVLA